MGKGQALGEINTPKIGKREAASFKSKNVTDASSKPHIELVKINLIF